VGDFVAVNVDTDQQQLEGNYWIAELLEGVSEADKDYSYHGEEIKAGFLVAKTRWLGYKSTGKFGARTYSRELDHRYLKNVMMRIDPVKMRDMGGVACKDKYLEPPKSKSVWLVRIST